MRHRPLETNRHQVIQELRHQLRYAASLDEQEAIRRELNFWIHYRQ